MRRIEPRPYRVGTGGTADPESLDDLQLRREKHERVTRGKPKRPFSAILADHMSDADADAALAEEEAPSSGAIDPHLGLDPRQDASLSNRRGHRSGKVIVKG